MKPQTLAIGATLVVLGSVFGMIKLAETTNPTTRNWDSFVTHDVTRLVQDRLRDPSSAGFRNIRMMPQSNPDQRVVCGEVNARTERGFTGYAPFAVSFQRQAATAVPGVPMIASAANANPSDSVRSMIGRLCALPEGVASGAARYAGGG